MTSIKGAKITGIGAANRFGVDLQEVLSKTEKGNLLYSPCSISIALAMSYLGARENTAAQLSKALNWETIPPQVLHSQMKTFLETINEVNCDNVELEMASRLFIRKDFGLSQEFREAAVKYYGVEEGLVDYRHDAAGARREVNLWVAQKTREEVKDLLVSKSAFDSRTKLTLVNTVYLKATWLSGAWELLPFPSTFIVKRGKDVKIQMITHRSRYKYRLANELGSCGCQILEIPLSQQSLSAFFLLPVVKPALGDLELSLTHHKLQRVLDLTAAVTPCDIQVEIPANFQMIQELQLKDALVTLGVTEIFKEGQADLSGVHEGQGNLHMTDVVHRAFVDITGQQNAVTNPQHADEATGSTQLVEPYKFCANYPFLFFIQHKSSGAIVFAGRMANPVPYCEPGEENTTKRACALI